MNYIVKNIVNQYLEYKEERIKELMAAFNITMEDIRERMRMELDGHNEYYYLDDVLVMSILGKYQNNGFKYVCINHYKEMES